MSVSQIDEITQPARQVSRWIAYPALAVFPVATIFAGIRLGELGIGEKFMITSMHSTPTENWVMSLLGICIATLVFGSWAYTNRTLRFTPMSLAFMVGYIVILFLFGTWGLYGIVAAWALWFAYFWFVGRRKLESGHPDDF